jgi:hypothetical protein
MSYRQSISPRRKSHPNHHQTKTSRSLQLRSHRPRSHPSKNRHQGIVKAVCLCNNGWVCEDHPKSTVGDDDCGAAGELCTSSRCDKDADSIFLTVHSNSAKPKRPGARLKSSMESGPIRRNTRVAKSQPYTPLSNRRQTLLTEDKHLSDIGHRACCKVFFLLKTAILLIQV